MVDVNVRALTSLSRLALPGLIARRAGGILNLASLAAFQAGPHLAVYYATKAYVLSLSEALHEEAKPHGVVVTALCPGPVRTEFIDKAGMGDLKLFRSAAMDAATVARAGVDGYEAGRAIVIPGARNRLGALGAKLLPRAVSRRVAGMIQRSR
jgi:short-subunit dehydrogenase